MTSAPRAQRPNEQPGIFGDPWNEYATTASKVRMALVFVALLTLSILFAATASAWVSGFGPEPEQARAVADASKANDAGRVAQSPIPVLGPSSLTAAQAEEFAQRLRTSPYGYSSSVSLAAYDVVVDGSSRRSAPDSAMRVSETERGLAVTFSRDGGDYQVEFVCRGPGSEAGASCVAEADALEYAAAFVTFGEDAAD